MNFLLSALALEGGTDYLCATDLQQSVYFDKLLQKRIAG